MVRCSNSKDNNNSKEQILKEGIYGVWYVDVHILAWKPVQNNSALRNDSVLRGDYGWRHSPWYVAESQI